MMVLRKLAVALLSAGVLLPGLGHALAVKELQTRSALGEPFQAEVELIELGDLNADEIKVSLASQEDFDRMGIDRVYFLTDLKFNVVVNQGGRSYISITSAKPVVEPYLDLVVRIAWPGNARLQEVTALLDPPVVVDSAAPDVTAAVSSGPAEVTATEPPPLESAPVEPVAPVTPAEAESPQPVIAEEKPPEPVVAPEPKPVAPAPVESSPKPALSADDYKVQPGDTMSSIAQRFRAGEATTPQAMIAIQRANPNAFAGGNLNQLKRGQVLRIPTESQMREVSSREALASVREQTDAWRAATGVPAKTPALEARQLDATAKTPAPEAAPAPESKPEMKLLGAQSGKAGAAAAGKEKAGAAKPEDARKLTEIKSLTENAQATKQKMAGKVETLDAKVKANDKQMELQNAKLAQLDAELKKAQALKEEASKSAKAAAPVPAETAKPEAAMPPAAETAQVNPPADAAQQAPVAPAQPVAPKPKVAVVEEPVEEESSPLPMIAGGVAALLAVLGGGWWWNQRRRREQAEAEAAIADLEGDDDNGLSDAGFQQDAAAGAGDSWQDSDWLNEATAAPAADRVLADPLEEVEQYIAYERYPQAAGLLNKAIAASPERADLRMKLLEVCAQMNDWSGFAQQEAWFESAGDLQAIARAEELKSGMSGSPAPVHDDGGDLDFASFSSSPAAAPRASDELPSLEDLEMDFNAGVSASSPALDTVKDSDLSSGGDMGLDFADFESEFNASAKPEATADDLSFELDTAAFDSEPAPAADAGLEFSLDEPEVASSAAGGSSLGELEDFENLPDLAPVESKPAAAKNVDDGLSFSLDDLELTADAEPAAASEMEFNLDEAAIEADDISLDDAVAADSGLDDLPMDFDATMKAEPEAAPVVAAAAPTADVAPAGDAGFGMDDEFDFLADTDENATKLDLARAYIDMGDMEGARDILQEVMTEGNTNQKDEAKGLLAQVG
jgi:pilus assembly protein FimV